jgi:hypothetical protein
MFSKIMLVAYFMSIFLLLSSSGLLRQDFLLFVTAQEEDDETSSIPSNLTNFIINIREISSFTGKNLIALLSSENDVQVKRVDISEAIIQPGQEDSFSPHKMIDVPITMNKPIEPGSEIYACVNQLGSTSFSQSIKCNIAYFSPTASGEPQRIIVPL